ncbi:hypothetical protein J0S26_24495, partial [Escherichia coli]|nr:hypothetical protein [Escherichia coli]
FAAGLLKGIRQAAALRFRLLTGGGFNPDEWREAPRLINRLDAGSVVLYCGQVRIPLYSITDWHRSPISDSHPFDQPGT